MTWNGVSTLLYTIPGRLLPAEVARVGPPPVETQTMSLTGHDSGILRLFLTAAAAGHGPRTGEVVGAVGVAWVVLCAVAWLKDFATRSAGVLAQANSAGPVRTAPILQMVFPIGAPRVRFGCQLSRLTVVLGASHGDGVWKRDIDLVRRLRIC